MVVPVFSCESIPRDTWDCSCVNGKEECLTFLLIVNMLLDFNAVKPFGDLQLFSPLLSVLLLVY